MPREASGHFLQEPQTHRGTGSVTGIVLFVLSPCYPYMFLPAHTATIGGISIPAIHWVSCPQGTVLPSSLNACLVVPSKRDDIKPIRQMPKGRAMARFAVYPRCTGNMTSPRGQALGTDRQEHNAKVIAGHHSRSVTRLGGVRPGHIPFPVTRVHECRSVMPNRAQATATGSPQGREGTAAAVSHFSWEQWKRLRSPGCGD